jgi:hypothetical protein
MVTFPDVGSSSATKVLNVVDFPAPLTPKRAMHSPFSSPKLKFSTAIRGYPALHSPDPVMYTFFIAYTLI